MGRKSRLIKQKKLNLSDDDDVKHSYSSKVKSEHENTRKRDVGTKVDGWIIDAIKQICIKSDGQLWGTYSKTVQRLLVNALRMEANKQHHTTISAISGKNMRADVVGRLLDIQNRIKVEWDYTQNKQIILHLNKIRDYVSEVWGNPDRRTLDKYIRLICRMCDEVSTSRWDMTNFLNHKFRT